MFSITWPWRPRAERPEIQDATRTRSPARTTSTTRIAAIEAAYRHGVPSVRLLDWPRRRCETRTSTSSAAPLRTTSKSPELSGRPTGRAARRSRGRAFGRSPSRHEPSVPAEARRGARWSVLAWRGSKNECCPAPIDNSHVGHACAGGRPDDGRPASRLRRLLRLSRGPMFAPWRFVAGLHHLRPCDRRRQRIGRRARDLQHGGKGYVLPMHSFDAARRTPDGVCSLCARPLRGSPVSGPRRPPRLCAPA
jgi:hypothetical protein